MLSDRHQVIEPDVLLRRGTGQRATFFLCRLIRVSLLLLGKTLFRHLERRGLSYKTFRDKQDGCIKVVLKPGMKETANA